MCALEPVNDFVKRIGGPLADELGEYLAAFVKPYRVAQQVKAMQKAKQMLKEAGIAPNAVPPRLLLPILEGASIEDDEDLHSRWAALLANAASSPDSVHPSYVEILKQLTPEDARLLDKLYDSCKSKRSRNVTPWIDQITVAELNKRVAAGENPQAPFQNLERLGLIEVVYTFDGMKVPVWLTQRGTTRFDADIGAELESHYELKESTDAFVQACRAPKTVDAGPHFDK